MGPRSGDRGNPGAQIEALYPYDVLQWGRDLEIAEIPAKIGLTTPEAEASMGPRSGDRGNIVIWLMAEGVSARFNGAAIWRLRK